MKTIHMKNARLKVFLTSPTARLAATYLAIILVMTIVFSVVLYDTSARELDRQRPPDSLFHNLIGPDGPSPSVDEFFQQRIYEARSELLMRLAILNLIALLLGGLLSYYLSRRTLKPIETAMEAQVQFVNDASHELRTPLTAIQTSNEVALRGTRLSLPAARNLIVQNTEDVKRLKSLSDGLLNLAQHKHPDVVLQAVKLQDIVSDAMTQVVQQASIKDIAVHDQVADIGVLGEASGLAQALVIHLTLKTLLPYSKNTQSLLPW